MASISFVDNITKVPAAWANDVNRITYTILGNAANIVDARTALGLAIGSDVHAYDANLALNTTALQVTSGQKVGIGISTPDSKLHILDASAGTIDSHAQALLTIENSSTSYIQMLNANTNGTGILFGDTDDIDIGSIVYLHINDTMNFTVSAALRMSLGYNGIYPPAAGETWLSIYDVDNAVLERVSVGAADSGGAGYKVLRIPN